MINRIGAAMLHTQRTRPQLVHDDPLALDRLERHRHMEVVPVRMQGHKVRTRPHFGSLEDCIQRHTVPAPARLNPGHIRELRRIGKPRQIVE